MSVSQVVPGGGFALSGMVLAIKALYGIAGAINEFIDDHIEKLKASDNPLIASTGRVLEGAKYGFGVGYVSSVAIIAVGQVLLGNTLAAAGTVLTAVTLTNPIAMTCAALGAIYYGWNALTEKERQQILENLSNGLAIGIELIRSLVEFVIRTSKSLMTSSQLEDFKKFVKAQAARFGKSLSDVTHTFGDVMQDGVDKTGEVLKDVAEKTGDAVGQATDAVGTVAQEVYDSVVAIPAKVKKAINGAGRERGKKSLSARDASIELPRLPMSVATVSAAARKTNLAKRRG